MTDFPFAVVGFDLDGTMFDTSEDIAAAVNHALTAEQRPTLTVAQIVTKIGGGSRNMLTKALKATGGCDEAVLNAVHTRMLDFYERNIAVRTAPYPGVIEAMESLRADGVAIAMVTNKAERLALTLLDALNLRDRFACVIGGDTLGPGNAKPSPAPILEMIDRCGGGRAAFVGDSIFDIEAAKAAGVPSVAVSFGFLDRPVETLGADATIDHFSELIPTLRALGR